MEISQNALKARAHCKYLKCESICQSVYFRNRVARAGSKLHRPGIFPVLEKLLRPAWLRSLLVQGAWIANFGLVSPQLFSLARSCTSQSYNAAWQPSPRAPGIQGCSGTANDAFMGKVFTLHITWTTLTSNTSNYYFKRVIQKGFTT